MCWGRRSRLRGAQAIVALVWGYSMEMCMTFLEEVVTVLKETITVRTGRLAYQAQGE